MRIKAAIFSILIMMIFTSASYAITAEEIVSNIQGIYDKAKDYSAEFYQESEMGTLKRVQKAMGIAYFKKNGRMYWEYKAPTEQRLVSNGKTVWLYQPDMNQVQVFKYKELAFSNTENSFLDGVGNLMKDFKVVYKGEEVEGNYVLELTPKEGTGFGFSDMEMHISKKTFNIIKTITTDAYGNKNTLNFKNTKFDTGINDDLFEFKVPKGVNVVTPND